MAEIYVDSNAPVRTKIFWKGQPIDADGTVTVGLYDITEDPAVNPAINPSTLLTTINAEKSEVDTGTYVIYLPKSYTNRSRKFKLVWSYSYESQNSSQTSLLDVVYPYANIEEAIEDLGISADQSDPKYKSYHDLQMAEKYARKIIENYTGQQFYLYDDVQIAYGSGSDILTLPFKLNSLHELYGNDILLIDNIVSPKVNNWLFDPQISETGFGLRVDRSQVLDNTVYLANGLVPPTIYGDNQFGAFKKGVRYRVQGKYGWDTVPDNVEQACIQLMGDYFAKDKAWSNKYIKKISTFDWDFEYSSDSYKGTGNAYVDQLLYPYLLNTMVVI